MRELRGTVTGVLAGVLVWCALVLPGVVPSLSVAGMLRIPLLGAVLLALLLVIPASAERLTARIVGGLLTLVVVLTALDIGFTVVVEERFHGYYDGMNLLRTVEVVAGRIGWLATIAVLVALAVALALLVVLLVRSVARLARLVRDHRTGSVRALLLGLLAWGLCALIGVQLAGAPVAAAPAGTLVTGHARAAVADHRDVQVFGDEIAEDPWRGRPALDGLQGKDVLVVFVESYGRSALEDPELADRLRPVLRSGTSSLAGEGVHARSAYLTSPLLGAGSWLAHSTLQSGVWVDDDRRYGQLLESDRLTLTRAFGDAGWRTFVMPSVVRPWTEGRAFYGTDVNHGAKDLHYEGPEIGWGGVPDQYTLDWVGREVLGGEQPVMAEVDLVSSHDPWEVTPRVLPWDRIGDGRVYDCMPRCGAADPDDDVRTRYAASIAYSLESVVSFLREHPDPVVVLLGDHQPWAEVTGGGDGYDVPVTILSDDPEVLRRISGWGWSEGLEPGDEAPVWRMDRFRDRFFSAYSGPAGAQ